MDFDSRVEIVQGFTNSFPDLEKAIRATTAGGSTSLHNAIYISLKELAKIKAKSQEDIRRRAIVLLSDGEDTSSLVSYEEVLDLAKRSETAIYTIGLQPKDTPQSKGFREAEFVLRQFAQETGGRAFFPSRAEELKDVWPDRKELSNRYSMGYASERRGGMAPGAASSFVLVRTTIARTKRGYYAPAHAEGLAYAPPCAVRARPCGCAKFSRIGRPLNGGPPTRRHEPPSRTSCEAASPRVKRAL